MSPVFQIVHAYIRWALEWIQMDMALTRIWARHHPAEVTIALLLVALLCAILACLPGSKEQEN